MPRLPILLAAALAAPLAHAQRPAPDALVTGAYRALLKDETLHYTFVITADDTVETRGRITSYTPPPDGVFHYRIESDTPGDPVLTFDGDVFQHRFARNRRVYVDSTAQTLLKSSAAALYFHPAFSLFLYQTAQNAEKHTYVGREAVDGRPCDRTRIVTPASEAGQRVIVSTCFDVATGLPHQMSVDVTPRTSSPVQLRFSAATFTPGAPPDTTFAPPLPEGWESRAYDGSDRPALIAAGTAAPDFTLLATDGTPVRLADLRGKLVLLDFWGTWCPPCIADIPTVQALADAHPDLVVLGMASFEEPEADPEGVARSHGARYRIVPTDDATAEAYSVEAVPAYVLIGRDGAVLYSALHDDDATALERLGTLLRSLNAR